MNNITDIYSYTYEDWISEYQNISASYVKEDLNCAEVIDMLIEYIHIEYGTSFYDQALKTFYQNQLENDAFITYLLEYIEDLNIKNGIPALFYHIKTEDPKLYNKKFTLPCTHTKLPNEIVQNLPLRHACKIGTLGKYKVLEKNYRVIPNSLKNSCDDIFLFILHCNIHNSPHRLFNIKIAKKSYSKLLYSVGVKDIIHISANELSTNYDIMFSKKICTNHEHWSPHYVASIMKRLYNKFPKSIILTHRYIGSLLLDNELFFKMHFLIDIDNPYTLKRCFSDILRDIKFNNSKFLI